MKTNLREDEAPRQNKCNIRRIYRTYHGNFCILIECSRPVRFLNENKKKFQVIHLLLTAMPCSVKLVDSTVFVLELSWRVRKSLFPR